MGIERLGKRVVWVMEDDLFFVFHLMIAGRFQWYDRRAAGAKGKFVLAWFEFDPGSLALLETGSRKRASLHVIDGREALAALDPGGIEVFEADLATFAARLGCENHTLKRALTDPRLFSGIGNAYADEILWTAGLSPLQFTAQLGEQAVQRLYEATQTVLREAIERRSAELGGRFPGPRDITAFRPEFAVHGQFGRPCPRCGATIERIRYAETETNYCPRCQTGGRVLADRALSRLLRDDWPRTVEEMEALRDSTRPDPPS